MLTTASLVQFMKAYHERKGRRSKRRKRGEGVTLSKTEDQGAVVETQGRTSVLKGFAKFDAKCVHGTTTHVARMHTLTCCPLG